VAHNMRAAACSCMVQKQPRHARRKLPHVCPTLCKGRSHMRPSDSLLSCQHALARAKALLHGCLRPKQAKSIVQYSPGSKEAPTR
jgi:hypothetical protein